MNTLKKDGVYWIDENHNKWSEEYYTEEEAIEYSKTLVNCYRCTDCSYCEYCSNCNDCMHCGFCSFCKGCRSCRCCYDCSDCERCSECSYCSKCFSCENCEYCKGYKQNPQRYITKKLGPLNDHLYFYWTNKDDVQVISDFFKGSFKDFEAEHREAIAKDSKRSESNAIRGIISFKEDYLKEIEKVKILIS